MVVAILILLFYRRRPPSSDIISLIISLKYWSCPTRSMYLDKSVAVKIPRRMLSFVIGNLLILCLVIIEVVSYMDASGPTESTGLDITSDACIFLGFFSLATILLTISLSDYSDRRKVCFMVSSFIISSLYFIY